jgi:hypothetical protein
VAAYRLRPFAVETYRLSGCGDGQNVSLCGQFAQQPLTTARTAVLQKLSTCYLQFTELTVHHLSLPTVTPIYITPLKLIHFTSVLILSSHLRPGFTSSPLPACFSAFHSPPLLLHSPPIQFALISAPTQFSLYSTSHKLLLTQFSPIP